MIIKCAKRLRPQDRLEVERTCSGCGQARIIKKETKAEEATVVVVVIKESTPERLRDFSLISRYDRRAYARKVLGLSQEEAPQQTLSSILNNASNEHSK